MSEAKDRAEGAKDKINVMWTVYILQCKDKLFYTELTSNLKNRLKRHASAKGNRFSARKPPQKLCYFELFEKKEQAIARELHIKRWSKMKKEALIEENFSKLTYLSKSRQKKYPPREFKEVL